MISEHLLEPLYQTFNWHPSRILTFIGCIKSLIKYGSVSLKSLSLETPSQGKEKAHVARVERLFALQEFDHEAMSSLVWKFLSPWADPNVILALDRTNWIMGAKDINYFVGSIIVNSVSVPLVWDVLATKGNSNTDQRKALMDLALSIIPKDRLGMVLADREFVGEEWFSYLVQKDVPFTIRIKANTLVQTQSGQSLAVSKLLEGKRGIVTEHVDLWGQKLWVSLVSGKPKKDCSQELVIVASNRLQGSEALAIYRKRWGIEKGFKSMKSEGFEIERTHLKAPERLKKLMAIVAFGTALSVATGKAKEREHPIKVKKTAELSGLTLLTAETI